MSVKDASQTGHLGLVEGAKGAVRPELGSDIEPADKITVTGIDPDQLASAIAAAQAASSAGHAQVVQALATAVCQGTYKPDPQRIAEQILDDAELIARLQSILRR